MSHRKRATQGTAPWARVGSGNLTSRRFHTGLLTTTGPFLLPEGNLTRSVSEILNGKFQMLSQTWQDCIEATSVSLKCGLRGFLDNVSVMEC